MVRPGLCGFEYLGRAGRERGVLGSFPLRNERDPGEEQAPRNQGAAPPPHASMHESADWWGEKWGPQKAFFFPDWRPCGLFFFFLIFIFIYLDAPDFSCGMWDLSSLTRDGTWAPSIGSTECHPLYHQGRPTLWALNTPVSPTPQHLASLQQ